jgi:hypothetical protein
VKAGEDNARALHPAALDAARLLSDCDVTRTRRSGPGGQNRNKVETAIVLRHRPTGIESQASERRSQAENLRNAIFRMRLRLALAVRRPFREPSALWKSRSCNGSIRVSPEHDDFPALEAEALDTLIHFQVDLKTTAGALGCTPSQLVKFLRNEPAAFQFLNDQRREAGLKPLQ